MINTTQEAQLCGDETCLPNHYLSYMFVAFSSDYDRYVIKYKIIKIFRIKKK